MARIRTLKPSFWTDRKVTRMSFAARLWFEGMWTFATCDHGHLDDDAYELRLKIFPADQVDEDALLSEVVGSGMVVRKSLPGGRTYLQVVHLADHSKFDTRWTPRCQYCAHENSGVVGKRDADSETPPELARVPASPPEPAETQEISPQGSKGLGLVVQSQNPSSPDGEGGDVDPGFLVDVEPPVPRGRADPFKAFYDAYPRKVGRIDAKAAFEKATQGKRRIVDPEVVIAAAERLRGDPNLPTDKTKIPHPATWLNRGGWEDEPYPPRTDFAGRELPPTGTSPWDSRR